MSQYIVNYSRLLFFAVVRLPYSSEVERSTQDFLHEVGTYFCGSPYLILTPLVNLVGTKFGYFGQNP